MLIISKGIKIFNTFGLNYLSMNRKLILMSSFLGATSIVLGAFGAHALKETLSLEQLVSFETGVRYQMYHALFLLFAGTTVSVSEKIKTQLLYMVTIGVILFSGSIYLLATQSLSGISFSFLGPVTPIGGLFLISSWFWLFFSTLKAKG